VGKFLWNTTVAELFTFARPVQSVWQIIGLMSLMRSGWRRRAPPHPLP
jgi:hypothetical protein